MGGTSVLRDFNVASAALRLLLALLCGGVSGTLLVLLTETVFRKLGGRIPHHPEYKVEIAYSEKTSLDNLLRYRKDSRMQIISLRIHSDGGDPGYIAEVHLRGAVQCDKLIEHVHRMPGIVSAVAL